MERSKHAGLRRKTRGHCAGSARPPRSQSRVVWPDRGGEIDLEGRACGKHRHSHRLRASQARAREAHRSRSRSCRWWLNPVSMQLHNVGSRKVQTLPHQQLGQCMTESQHCLGLPLNQTSTLFRDRQRGAKSDQSTREYIPSRPRLFRSPLWPRWPPWPHIAGMHVKLWEKLVPGGYASVTSEGLR